jgi:hypothetical protein
MVGKLQKAGSWREDRRRNNRAWWVLSVILVIQRRRSHSSLTASLNAEVKCWHIGLWSTCYDVLTWWNHLIMPFSEHILLSDTWLCMVHMYVCTCVLLKNLVTTTIHKSPIKINEKMAKLPSSLKLLWVIGERCFILIKGLTNSIGLSLALYHSCQKTPAPQPI